MARAPDPEEEFITRATRMLQAALGPRVRVVQSQALTQERSVWRCRVASPSAPPRSVIVRAKREIGGWRTEQSYLRTDYFATAFLQERCPGITPRIVAADLDAGIYATEDLGAGPSLMDLLSGTARPDAADGLRAFAATLGRLHAATAGLGDEYYRRRRELGPVDAVGYRTSLAEHSLTDAAGRLLDAAAPGRAAPRPARAEAREILLSLAEPGAFLALSSGDPCPYNCLVSGGSARLFDFELAGYRHALLDVAYVHLGFHWCYQPGLIPPDVLAEADVAYRREAGSGIPAVLDEAVYRRALAAAAGAWALLAGVAVADHLAAARTVPAIRAAHHLATLRLWVAMARRSSCFPALADWISGLVSASGRDGPDGTRDVFPSFAVPSA